MTPKMNFKQSKLNNGLSVQSVETKGFGLETITVWFRQGYRDEKEDEDSYYHLLEHALMSGSDNYPSEEIINKVVADTGSYFNASVWIEHLNVEAQCLMIHLDSIFDLLADLILRPLIKEEVVIQESKIINEELLKHSTDPQRTLAYYSAISMYNNTPLANLGFGRMRNIKGATAEKLLNIYKRILNPSEMAIIGMGGASHDRILKLAEDRFGQISSRPPIKRLIAEPEPQLFQSTSEEKKSTNVHFCLPAVEYRHPDFPVFNIINSYLSQGMDSLLYRELRLKRGLVYSISANNSSFSDAGYWFVSFSSSQPDQVIDIIKQILIDLQFDQSMLNQTQKRILAKTDRIFNANHLWAIKSLGRSFSCLGHLETLIEAEEKINRVSVNDVNRIIKSYLNPERALVIRI